MEDTTNPQFKLVVPITGYTIRKDAKGVEKYVLTGLASNTNLDLTGERMADSAITAMVKSIETNKIYLNNEHSSDWDADFGEVTKLWSTDTHELMMEAELDPSHYRTKTLIKALDKGKKLGLSIGGYVKEAAREWFADAARMVMTYKDISLFHVAITGTPAVAETWVTPITKSVKDWKEMPMPNEQTTKSDEGVETPAVETVADAVEETGKTPVVEPVAEPSKPAEVTPEAPVETPVADVVEKPAEPTKEEAEVAEEVPVVETPLEAPDTTPAEGDKPDAPETDTTHKSDAPAVEKPAEAEVTPEPESTPVVDDAPEQKDETPASVESAPAPAETDTSEVAKSVVFGDYDQADVAQISVRSLTETLSYAVWGAVYTSGDDKRSPDERKAYVATALAEYGAIVQSVANALIENGVTDQAEKSFVIDRAESITKSLDEKDAKVTELTKSLADTEVKLETTTSDLDTRTGELETTTKALQEAQTQLATITARKAIVFDKFTGAETNESSDTDATVKEAQQKFASFITSGAARS